MANGNDSTIIIPFDMEFDELEQYFHSKQVTEALGGIGGATSILNGFLANITPILNLIFLIKFANIMLDIYKKEYFSELNSYISHATQMLNKFAAEDEHLSSEQKLEEKSRIDRRRKMR